MRARIDRSCRPTWARHGRWCVPAWRGGSSKRRSSCRTSAVRGLPDPLGSPSGFPSYALPFYSASGLLRVLIRLTAIRACPRTCIRGKGTREHSARKEALLVCFQVERPLRASKPRLLESHDDGNTPPRPSPSACRPRALAADMQVPLALPCTGRFLILRYCIHAPPEAGGTPTFGAKGPIVGLAAPRAIIRRLFARLRVCVRMKRRRFESPIGNAQEHIGLPFEQLVCRLLFASGPPPLPSPVLRLIPHGIQPAWPCKDAHHPNRSGTPGRVRLGTAWVCFVQRCWLSGSPAHARGFAVPPPDCRAVAEVGPRRH